MLQKLTIKNVALIDNAEINFEKGLNVLSGETGAGKSVIIESLNFVLGAKADKTLIRSGETEAQVTAEFYVSDSAVLDVLEDIGFERDNVIIITRKFSLDGKNTIKLNGNTVTVNMLKKVTSCLVDVHGQSEHFSLLSSQNQLKLIDKFGGEELENLKNEIYVVYSELKSIREQLNDLGGDDSQRAIRLDILNYQIKEITDADLKENEEQELLEIRKKLQNQEKIINGLNAIKESVSNEGGILDILSNANRTLYQISEFSEEYKSLYERLNNSYSEIDDISNTANNLLEQLDFTEYDPNYIESRLDLIKTLKKKYGMNGYQEIMKFLDNAVTEKAKLENFNENAEKLLLSEQQLKDKLYSQYVNLSNLRRKNADIFAENIVKELFELGMPKAKFNVKFNELTSKDDCVFNSANGIDEVEFEFSANLGEPLKPLSYVISGGEMSRFMLGIKAQTAKFNDISTFIFDEIDAGISGNVAKIVAEKFAKISKNVQLIAITHLPQISAMADNNLLIVKSELKERAKTDVIILNEREKIKEIARLAGGDTDSETAIAYAKSIIDNANRYKKEI